MNEAQSLSDDIAILINGSLQLYETLQDLIASARKQTNLLISIVKEYSATIKYDANNLVRI